MNHNRLVAALSKHVKVKEVEKGRYYTAQNNEHICSWYLQDDSAICVKVRRLNDEDDMCTDYCAGWFARTIKSVVETFKKGKTSGQ